MTAGEGIVHGEMFPLINEHKGNPTKFFQVPPLPLSLSFSLSLLSLSFSQFLAPSLARALSLQTSRQVARAGTRALQIRGGCACACVRV